MILLMMWGGLLCHRLMFVRTWPFCLMVSLSTRESLNKRNRCFRQRISSICIVYRSAFMVRLPYLLFFFGAGDHLRHACAIAREKHQTNIALHLHVSH